MFLFRNILFLGCWKWWNRVPDTISFISPVCVCVCVCANTKYQWLLYEDLVLASVARFQGSNQLSTWPQNAPRLYINVALVLVLAGPMLFLPTVLISPPSLPTHTSTPALSLPCPLCPTWWTREGSCPLQTDCPHSVGWFLHWEVSSCHKPDHLRSSPC